MNNTHPTRPEVDDRHGTLSSFGFDAPRDAWMDRIRAADAPFPYGCMGAYELLEEVSRGGQGIVYRACDPRTGRQFALKRLLAGSFATASMRRRFEREVEALTALAHPNVVSIFGVDLVDGMPVLAMEWIDGIPITRWAAGDGAERRATDDIVGMFLKVCDGVHHAHQRGVIHRDLKPANILVVDELQIADPPLTSAAADVKGCRLQIDDRPRTQDKSANCNLKSAIPKILDFGLAKLAAADNTSGSDAPTAQFVGTLAYASPEQLFGKPAEVDVRADVYSLGVLLFEMLTGRLPYDVGNTLATAARAVERGEPLRPSAIAKHLDHDLDAITLKAIAKEPRARYQSVDALAGDLRCYLAGELVSARTPSGAAQLLKTLRRHRTAVAFTATVFALVTAFALVATVLAARLAQQRDLALAAQRNEAAARQSAEQETAKASAVSAFLRDTLAAVDPMWGRAHNEAFQEVLAAAAQRIDAELAGHPAAEADVRIVLGITYHSMGLHADAELHLRRALELRRALHEGDHPAVAAALNELGHLCTSQANYGEAELLLREALRMRRDLAADEHPDGGLDVAVSLNNLAKLLHLKGEYAGSDPLWREALEIRRRLLGPVNAVTASSLHNLAANTQAQGDLVTAETLFEEALDIARQARGEEHPDVAYTLHSLAGVLNARGDLAASEVHYRQSLALKRKSLGDGHPAVGFTLNNLAEVLSARGSYEEAERLFLEALDIYAQTLNPNHPRVVTSLNSIVQLYDAWEKPQEAAEFRGRLAGLEP